MNSTLQNKKLLFLGGNPETTYIVDYANDLGIETYVTSARVTDPAKKSAKHAYDIDGMDVDGIVELVQKEKIDGVLVGVADILVPAYVKVCERLGFPCYASEKITDCFSFKDNFKRTCESFGLKGIKEFHLTAEMLPEDIAKIEYPVMVKPVDNGAGVGMSVAYNESELKAAVEKALENSKKKRFLVERYMVCDDFAIYYTFKDGYCSVSCAFDRYTEGEQKGVSRVNLGSLYPSKHIADYMEKVHPKAVKMFEAMGIRDGVLLMQAFYENGEFYFYDPGFRLQGEGCHFLIANINGFDQRELLINFALTGSMGPIDLKKEDDVYFRGKKATVLYFLLKKGTIGKIEGLDGLDKDPRVIFNLQRLREGQEVPEEWIGTERQTLNKLYLVCDTKEELAEAIQEYREKIRAYDTDGNLMNIPGFDPYKELGIS